MSFKDDAWDYCENAANVPIVQSAQTCLCLCACAHAHTTQSWSTPSVLTITDPAVSNSVCVCICDNWSGSTLDPVMVDLHLPPAQPVYPTLSGDRGRGGSQVCVPFCPGLKATLWCFNFQSLRIFGEIGLNSSKLSNQLRLKQLIVLNKDLRDVSCTCNTHTYFW